MICRGSASQIAEVLPQYNKDAVLAQPMHNSIGMHHKIPVEPAQQHESVTEHYGMLYQ